MPQAYPMAICERSTIVGKNGHQPRERKISDTGPRQAAKDRGRPMKAYRPNFRDPRVKSRCQQAIGFVTGTMSRDRPQQWSSKYIEKYLGRTNTPLGRYLWHNLVICRDEYFRFNSSDGSVCKKYVLNQEGVDRIMRAMCLDPKQISATCQDLIQKEHSDELKSGQFQYTDKSHRLWHPLQRYRRAVRSKILDDHGYHYQYDIQCCAPTLIHQYSQRIPEIIDHRGRWQQGPMDLYLFALRRYLSEKDQVRNELAEQLELPVQAVKEVINALFAGAQISLNPRSDISEILCGDRSRIMWLKQDRYVQELVSDIKTCWEYIRPVMPLRTKIDSRGRQRRLPINARQKWLLYFQLERSVMDSVRDYLDTRSVRYFLIHDGWCTDRQIDRDELRDFLCEKTGFSMIIDHRQIDGDISL